MSEDAIWTAFKLSLSALPGVGILTGFIWEPIKFVAENLAKAAQVIISMLPDAGDLGLTTMSGWIKGYTMLNTFLPISEGLAFAAIFATFIAASMAVRLATWIYHLIPKPGMGT